MPKNIKRYYRAWQLRRQGKKLKEIGKIMGFGVERARFMIHYVDFLTKEKPYIMSKELKELTKIGI